MTVPVPRARVLVTLALVALLAAPALAHPGDRRPHVQSFQEIRDVSATALEDGVEFTLTRPTHPLADVVRLRYHGSTGEVAYEYRRDAADPDTAFGFSVILDALVEYRDVNGNARFDAGVDALAKRYPASTMRWEYEELPPLKVGRGLQEKKDAPHVVANGSFGLGGAFRVQFYAAGHQLETGAARLHPQDVKMVWNYASFPFAHEDSRFALVTRLVTPSDVNALQEFNADGVQTGVVFRSATRLGFFDWADYALGNSTSEPVSEKTVLAHVGDARPSAEREGFTERVIVFSYPRADYLLSHDPTVGLEYAPPEPPAFLGFNPLWFLGIALVGAVSGGGYWYARKGGRERVTEWVRALTK